MVLGLGSWPWLFDACWASLAGRKLGHLISEPTPKKNSMPVVFRCRSGLHWAAELAPRKNMGPAVVRCRAGLR
jgi:hypothetical protein